MTDGKRRPGTLIAGAGGAALIASLFLPWADIHGTSRNGWEIWTTSDVYIVLVGVVAIAAAITGGRFGVFRPDLTLIAATDLLGVVSTVLIGWLLLFDLPPGASPDAGIYVALAAAVVVMCGAGDYSVMRGAPLFPRVSATRRAADR
jgi:hypothetical protein